MNIKMLKMAFAGVVLSISGFVNAGLIIVDFNTTLGISSGSDTGGLDGAIVSIHAEFDDTSIYVNRFGFPTVEALLHSIIISSASVGSSNGTFIDPDGLTYFPTFNNSFETTTGDFLSAGPLINGVLMETAPGSVIPSIGDLISVDHFNTSVFDPRSLAFGSVDGSLYNWTQSSLSVTSSQTAVPEPSTLAIFALGIMGLASRRFKK